MKKIRQISQNPIVIALVLFNFIFVSCNRDEIIKNYEDTSTDKTVFSKVGNNPSNLTYTDIDVFKGIMFIEGPVADKFPEFKELNFRNFIKEPQKINQILRFQNDVINHIITNNPKYLKEFRDNITSGNYYLVRETVLNASNLVKQETILLTNINSKDVNSHSEKFMKENGLNPNSSIKDIVKAVKNNSNKIKPGSTWYYDSDTFVYSAVAVVAVVAAVAVVSVVLSIPLVNSDNNENNNSSYLADKYISDITLNMQTK